jgi:hypothetical protein
MADKGDGVAAGTVFGNVPEVQAEIMGAVLRERASQDAKFGTQDHPDVDPSFAAPGRVGGRLAMTWISERLGLPSADVARVRRIAARESGSLSWFHVLAEWTAEACEAATLAQQGQGSEAAVDRRLVKVMATAMACLEARARRRAAAPLRCFTNGTDRVSARDFDDAEVVLREVYGDDTAATDGLRQVPDAEEFVVCLDVPPPTPAEPCDACKVVRPLAGQSTRNSHLIGCAVGAPLRPAAEWASEGRGLISSTEV